ncbi:MAG: helix-turn-helix transcriptional regulator [Oscillospiraceae bacterium]|nr:helix-turn-helix transcriptional regulator [Oscillospiraceae bacterium]
MTLGDRLIEARTGKGYSQKEFAAILGISPTRYNYWEKNKAEPNISYILKICVLLEVSGDWLLGLSKNKKNKPIENNKLVNIRQALMGLVSSMDDKDLPDVLKYAEYIDSRSGD